MRNREITAPGLLLTEKGALRAPGWSRSQVQEYRRSMIGAPKFRIKEWDYYLVVNDGFAAAFTISDDGYIGLQSVSLLIFGEHPREHTETVLNAFPMGRLRLPENSSSGVTAYSDRRLQMSFEPKDGKRYLKCRFENFSQGKTLDAEIVLHQPPADTMVIATPWPKKHAFYYNQKINCMRAEGRIVFDNKTYEFDPATDFGTLDWGRGVWTYDNTWYWGSGNTVVDGHTFGWNIGYGFGDTSAASENVLFFDGKAHKLDDVTFGIPESGYMDDWRFSSSDGRFEMTFKPVLDRAARMDFLVVASDQHQVFGRMSGRAILDDGAEVRISDVLCFAEKVRNKY
ncbi:MAG: DUF2804 domain-containing protein [Clostridia bacterium]|nr:DUF2804 domain-containing protein [Clostridia bacterium]